MTLFGLRSLLDIHSRKVEDVISFRFLLQLSDKVLAIGLIYFAFRSRQL